MTTDELHEAEARYKRASTLAEQAREHRNWCVLDALKNGWTHQQISEATGLSRGRIGQIAQTGRKR